MSKFMNVEKKRQNDLLFMAHGNSLEKKSEPMIFVIENTLVALQIVWADNKFGFVMNSSKLRASGPTFLINYLVWALLLTIWCVRGLGSMKRTSESHTAALAACRPPGRLASLLPPPRYLHLRLA
jgi:hypothetical protein